MHNCSYIRTSHTQYAYQIANLLYFSNPPLIMAAEMTDHRRVCPSASSLTQLTNNMTTDWYWWQADTTLAYSIHTLQYIATRIHSNTYTLQYIATRIHSSTYTLQYIARHVHIHGYGHRHCTTKTTNQGEGGGSPGPDKRNKCYLGVKQLTYTKYHLTTCVALPQLHYTTLL